MAVRHSNQNYIFSGTGLMHSLMVACIFVAIIFLSGCASVRSNSDVLAFVDGEPITVGDLNYSLAIEHRREDLSKTGKLDILHYLNSLIDERLIIQEARRMEMDNYPDAIEKMNAYILRESVVRLHKDEILNKVVVSDEDILEYYKANYERLTVDIIEVDTEDTASQILDRLKGGENFREIAMELPNYKEKDEDMVFNFGSFTQSFQDKIVSLMPGEFTDVIKSDGKFFIVKILGREEAADDKLAGARGHIVKTLSNQKEEARSKEYLDELRIKYSVEIDHELLASIDLKDIETAHQKWADDERPLVFIMGEPLSVKEFIAILPPVIKISNEDLISNWINRRIVDDEALSRRYDLEPQLSTMIKNYENQVLKNIFIKEVIFPEIKVSDALLMNYYNEHQDDYTEPLSYKFQMILVETSEEADGIYSSLQKGADFSWLAKMRSSDVKTAEKGGNLGWLTLDQLPAPLRDIIDTIKPGDLSTVLFLDPMFGIARLQEISEKKVKDFAIVRQLVFNAYMAEHYKIINDDYIKKLKSDSEIIVDEKAVRSFENIFK